MSHSEKSRSVRFSAMSQAVLIGSCMLLAVDLASAATPRGRTRIAGQNSKATSSKTTKGKLSLEPFNKKTVRVPIEGVTSFEPPLKRGDRELGGPTDIVIRARFYTQNNRVYRQIFMYAGERTITGGLFSSKPTVGEGWSPPELVFTAEPGWTLKPFRITDHRLPKYIDNDHTPEDFGTQIGVVSVYGDRKGDDIGCYTRVRVLWNMELPVELTRREVVTR